MSFFRIFKTQKAADERAEQIKKQGCIPSVMVGKDHNGKPLIVVQNSGKININPNK